MKVGQDEEEIAIFIYDYEFGARAHLHHDESSRIVEGSFSANQIFWHRQESDSYSHDSGYIPKICGEC